MNILVKNSKIRRKIVTEKNWNRIGNFIIALIILVLTIPDLNNSYTNNYNLSFCNNSNLNHDPDIIDTYEVEIEKFDFLSCEIGYLEGEMNLKFQLFSSKSDGENGGQLPLSGSIDILILNHQNYNNFYNGENYGVSNIEFLSLKITQEEDMNRDFASIDFQSDYYFLVLDWCSSSCNVDYEEEGNSSDNIGIIYSIDLKHKSSDNFNIPNN